ncbi:uncharacterized protein [Antedon mediterranea]|uniref:uncharacterized protein n=1 Tax=Antedon mediterranea TaxID=105859 RepID=UPI003AF42297
MARIIRECMKEEGLDRQDVQKKYKIQSVHDHGTYQCRRCGHSWSSYHSCLTLDLQQQRIARRWRQKCDRCKKIESPWFHQNVLEDMVEYGIRRYFKLVKGTLNGSVAIKPKGKPPHRSDLCERCGFGKRQCWISRNNSSHSDL